MTQRLLHLFLTFGIITVGFAQDYTTPNTGMIYSLDDLVTESPSTMSVSGATYTMVGNITISENDTLLIDSDLTLEIGAELLITVFGTFTVTAEDVTFTAIDTAAPYEGFRFEEFSEVDIQNSTIQYGGGLRVLTETFTLNNCTVTNNVSGAATGSVIALSRGVAQITNNSITFNETPAISSGANNAVSAYIFNNYIEGNNQENSNRPQINMGATMTTDTLKIIQNTIKGDVSLTSVGGIAVANLVGGNVKAIIDDNIIQDNRYGITVVGGNSFAYIRDNIIEDNDTQNNPNLGGSGISLSNGSNSMDVVARGNQIRRNLWGITVLSGASINLGDDDGNAGQNVFSDNGNGGTTYALYNNTSNTLSAMNNCWDEANAPITLEDAEAVIVHQVDDSSLGEVLFDPVNCVFLGVDPISSENIAIYPNPTEGRLFIANNSEFNTLNVYTLEGKLIFESPLNTGTQELYLDLHTGMYLMELKGANVGLIKKLMVN
ncbi:T9SS type A sorting domain-containing protein [Sediminibacter sp. Hel_I_10]|uniref:T9SS type A sorting domain-containing protein n=1 Tax=Sediminibacter sp. Hel_I_10 TaxID=1392490 RepID=UPI00047EC407|nr:T9SS type A sorting domain-containing protein [Sediminibacter sp. Hel_I_10]